MISGDELSRENTMNPSYVEKFRSYSYGGPKLENNLTKRLNESPINPKNQEMTGANEETGYKTFILGHDANTFNRSRTLMMLEESDIKLSKPVIIKNIVPENIKSN